MKIRKKIKKAKKLLKNYAYPVDCESCPVDREECSLEADDVGCHYVLEKFIAENEIEVTK